MTAVFHEMPSRSGENERRRGDEMLLEHSRNPFVFLEIFS